jgi:outer membrane lipoprotein-sorting protein
MACGELYMNKQKILLGLTATMVCFLMISGCTQPSPQPTKATIQDILARARNIGPVKYNVISTYYINESFMMNRTKTIWEELPYMKVNILLGNTSAVLIKRPDGVYERNPGEHKYNKSMSKFSEQPLENQSNALLSNISFSVVGNETINGNVATVLQYTKKEGESLDTTKVWIWNEKGIIVKSQTTTFMGKTAFVTDITNENFVFGDIPLSEFSVT